MYFSPDLARAGGGVGAEARARPAVGPPRGQERRRPSGAGPLTPWPWHTRDRDAAAAAAAAALWRVEVVQVDRREEVEQEELAAACPAHARAATGWPLRVLPALASSPPPAAPASPRRRGEGRGGPAAGRVSPSPPLSPGDGDRSEDARRRGKRWKARTTTTRATRREATAPYRCAARRRCGIRERRPPSIRRRRASLDLAAPTLFLGGLPSPLLPAGVGRAGPAPRRGRGRRRLGRCRRRPGEVNQRAPPAFRGLCSSRPRSSSGTCSTSTSTYATSWFSKTSPFRTPSPPSSSHQEFRILLHHAHVAADPKPRLFLKQYAKILPLALIHMLGNVFTYVSLGMVAVSFTLAIKAMEPFFSVLSVVFLGEAAYLAVMRTISTSI